MRQICLNGALAVLVVLPVVLVAERAQADSYETLKRLNEQFVTYAQESRLQEAEKVLRQMIEIAERDFAQNRQMLSAMLGMCRATFCRSGSIRCKHGSMNKTR